MDHNTYKARHKWLKFWKGPNILKVSTGEPYALGMKNGKSLEIQTSERLEEIVADEFRGSFEDGAAKFPEDVKNKMKNQDELPENKRYMGSDWGLLGPNCVTTSFDTLEEALDSILQSPNAPEELKAEAKRIKSQLENLEHVTPKGVREAMDSNFVEEGQDIPPAHVRQWIPDSLIKAEEHDAQDFDREEWRRMEEEN